MGLFRRKKVDSVNIQADKVELNTPTPTKEDEALLEIVAHDDARKEVVEKAKQVNNHLKELLVENGFTIKIYLAAGGRPPQPRKRQN